MGIHVIRLARDLGEGYVLAPERFDPRRTIAVDSTRRVGDVARVVTENVTAHSFSGERPVLVLDTTHAYEGFVILRHDPAPPQGLGSAKRRLLPEDVIISRLRPYLRQVAFVGEELFRLTPAGNDVCASTEFFVVRGREGFDAAALVPFLLSDPVQRALAAGQEGGHHPRFSKELLESIPVPDSLVGSSRATGQRVRELAASVLRALGNGREMVGAVEQEMRKAARLEPDRSR